MNSMTTDEELQELPLHDWHCALGARMVPFAGYLMPLQYQGIVSEHEWTRGSAGLFDVSHMGQLSLTGDGVVEDLEALLPASISSLAEGRMRYSLLLNEDGGVLDDLIVTNRGGSYSLVVNGSMKIQDIEHIRKHLSSGTSLEHLQSQALLALQGPSAPGVLEEIVPGVSDLVFMTASEFEWGGISLWISRAGYTGEDGFEISIGGDDAARLADAILRDERVRPIGLGARDSLRLEAGLPLYGHDLDPSTDPISAGLLFALSPKRREAGGWIGHDVCMRVLKDGRALRRTGLLIEGRLPAREGAKVFCGELEVGRVTSGGFSPTLKQPIAMAYLLSEFSGPAHHLEIEVRSRRVAARTVSMPFVPHRYFRGK